MKLRWNVMNDKIWKDFIHTSGSMIGQKDGGYMVVPNDDVKLEYYDEASDAWLEVEEVV